MTAVNLLLKQCWPSSGSICRVLFNRIRPHFYLDFYSFMVRTIDPRTERITRLAFLGFKEFGHITINVTVNGEVK